MTLLEEAIMAGRGVVALLFGKRDAPIYFNLTPHGLVGSFIGLLIGFAFVAVVQNLGPEELREVSLWQMLWQDAVTYAVVAAAVGLILRQMNRGDQLISYLIAGNWSGTFSTILLAFGLLLSPAAMTSSSIVILIAAVIIEINIIRIIVGLKSWAVVAVIAGQALSVGLLSFIL